MAKGHDLLMYITQRVTTYVDTPKEERRQRKAEPKVKEPWSYRWFGLVPFAVKMWADQKLKGRRNLVDPVDTTKTPRP